MLEGMLRIRTSVKPSLTHGLGLFAEERIPAGTVIWCFDPGFDQTFTDDQIEALAPGVRRLIWHYTYRDMNSGLLVLCADNARYFNHSDSPNTYDRPDGEFGETIARVDIEPGEEITNNYFVDDRDAEAKLRRRVENGK